MYPISIDLVTFSVFLYTIFLRGEPTILCAKSLVAAPDVSFWNFRQQCTGNIAQCNSALCEL